jgi:uncharacterized protein (DUF2252 family)
MTALPAASSVYDEIVQFNADRDREMVKRKLRRLDESVFKFFRGTDHLFGQAWPALRARDPGPAIQGSGDLHLENFGACQAEDGDFRFEINDFDESLVAPCSFDLVRCTASTLLAGQEWGLSPLDASGIALAFLDRYRAAIIESNSSGVIGEIAPRNGDGPVWDLLNATALGTQVKLLDQQTALKRNGTRRILRSPDKHPEIDKKHEKQVRHAVEAYGAAKGKAKASKVLDVTGRIAGIGSLGLQRYLVLVEGRGSPDKNLLLDVKEARPSSVLQYVDCPQPETYPTEADRVVAAQRKMQAKPMLGLGTLEIAGRSFRIREMVPDESHSSLEHLQRRPKKLRKAVETIGQLVGWSQLRGTNPAGRKSIGRWVTGAGLDAVLAAAVRFADHTQQQYAEYHKAFAASKNR